MGGGVWVTALQLDTDYSVWTIVSILKVWMIWEVKREGIMGVAPDTVELTQHSRNPQCSLCSCGCTQELSPSLQSEATQMCPL